MAMPLTTAQTIDINVARQQIGVPPRPRDPAEQLNESKIRLLSALQTTLDLDTLLGLFFGELRSLITLSGLRYVNDQTNQQISLGDHDAHSSAYRLIIQERTLGEITVFRSQRFSDKELELLENLLSTLLCPLRNALTYGEALAASMTDTLTGAGNRLALMEQLNREIHVARRYQHPLSVLMIDIDKFKHINDQHGHASGDKVLQELVRLVRLVNRSSDTCYRMGGEEFVVVLSNTHLGGARIIAERLCRAIADLNICTDSGSLRITASIGVAGFCETDTVESLVNRADKAMYDAKRSGGNRMVSI